MAGGVEAVARAKEEASRELEGVAAESTRELLLRYEALRSESKRRTTEERILFLKPHAKQQAFIAAGKKFRIRCVSGGNRSGKSEIECAEVVAHAIGFRPWLPKDHEDYWVIHPATGERFQHPARILVVGESFGEQVQKVLLYKMLGNPETGEGGLIPKRMIRSVKRNQQGIIHEIRFKDGSVIYFKSYEQDVKLFESENYDAYALDEPPPRAHYVAISRGATDTQAPIWMAFTPLSQAWIIDELFDEEKRPDVWKIYMDIRDNIGFGLTEKAVEQFERDLDEDEKETRLHGKSFHLRGVVYKEFSREIHLLPRYGPKWKWPKGRGWQYAMHVDPHKRKRHVCVWCAIRPDGTYLAIAEAQNPPSSNLISTTAEIILDTEKELGIPHDWWIRLIDPLAEEPGVTGEKELSIKDDFENFGLYFKTGSKKRSTAIQYMHKLLRHRKSEGYHPKFYLFEDLKESIKEFERYQWDEHKDKRAKEEKDPKDVPRKKHDDRIEGYHRIILETYDPEMDDDVNEDDDEDDKYTRDDSPGPIRGFSVGR